MNDEISKFSLTRIGAALLIGPLIGIPPGILLMKILTGFEFGTIIAILLPSAYLFTLVWGGITHVVLQQTGKTGLGYYLGSYSLIAGSVILYFLGGDFHWMVFGLLMAFAVVGATIPCTCWWLYYRSGLFAKYT